MNPRFPFPSLATLCLLISFPTLQAADSATLPSAAEKEALAQSAEQLTQQSAELRTKSAEAVQRLDNLHAEVGSALAERRAQEEAKTREAVAKWVAALELHDAAKETRVLALIGAHLKAVRDWHNAHPGDAVPEVDPANGRKRNSLERQFIADSAMPRDSHKVLMEGLRRELSPAQVEAALDSYTEGKVAFTLKGYKAIVPDLTLKEEEVILRLLKTAREEAIDYKGSKLISRVFETYKTQCEQYLNSNGRNWKQLYKAYTDAVKAKKAAEKQAQ